MCHNGNALLVTRKNVYFNTEKRCSQTWHFPSDWATVKPLYKLTDQGKTEEQELAVKDGKDHTRPSSKLTICSYRSKQTNPEMSWSLKECTSMTKDLTVNLRSLEDWRWCFKATVVKSQGVRTKCSIQGNKEKLVSLKIDWFSQILNMLSMSVLIIVVMLKQSITVNTGEKEVTNYTNKSLL